MQDFKESIKNRAMFYFAVIFLLFVIIAFRLLWIQVINSAEYKDRALNQRMREFVVNSERGIIYDNTGRKLAVSLAAKTVVALPDSIIDPQKTAQELAGLLDVNYDTIYRRITSDAAAIFLQRKINDQLHEELLARDIPGIIFIDESKRHYPEGELASHIIGFTGIDNNGLSGLELSYNNYLVGKEGRMAVERDAAGKPIPAGIRESVPVQNGHNLHLTIDQVIQYFAERELKLAEENFDISGGSIIVMDSQNGDVLALANTPTYDPNNFNNYPEKNWRNRAINDVFEPGSTFKIITTAAALEEGVISENDILTDPGHIYVGRHEISCWSDRGHGAHTFANVVKTSCNPGFVEVALKMEKDTFYSYIDAFGFGKRSSIRLPAEADGLLPEYNRIGEVELATFSFGHGLSVTPIQLASAVSAVANGGKLMQPRLVKEVDRGAEQSNLINEPSVVRQVISEQTANKTRELLKQTVLNGTGTQAAIEGYEIAGKTGTAQHYNEDLYDASFVGIVPTENTDLTVLVILYDITGDTYYGSQTAAPVFRNLGENILSYLDVKPDFTQQPGYELSDEKLTVPEIRNLSKFEAEQSLREKGFNVKIQGDGDKIIDQLPKAGALVNKNSTVWLFDDKVENYNVLIPVPDFRGMELEAVKELAALRGLKISSSGSGKVIGQSVYPGRRIKTDQVISLKLQ
ncbi:PASTA domain-containing protein [Halanaerobium sp. Z-7514]|uniref:PASTA domain-containing protein n=1 Tax=Halanaerobium polyolivorans TaxID=2886943 RepID=A0AAW4WZH0_9FIRM|nr:PASTA domain-containing penicillin-binding protein [Halanaerobium polyolivorans]MCC3144742.1 PASTA domain-containing protein [Halanaerobium polyolivorans]